MVVLKEEPPLFSKYILKILKKIESDSLEIIINYHKKGYKKIIILLYIIICHQLIKVIRLC